MIWDARRKEYKIYENFGLELLWSACVSFDVHAL